jgi:His-Xaa-Ser system protein HxsD
MGSEIEYGADFLVDASLYSDDIVLRACYRLTDQFYVFVSRLENEGLAIKLAPKPGTPQNRDPCGELSNLLIDESIRARVRIETAGVREHIVRCALAEMVGCE